MDQFNFVKAFILGLVEGGTEFIPVSSTGHLILIGHLLGFDSPNRTFEVLVQLGAILALMAVYFTRLIGIAACLRTDEWARKFVMSVLVAFLPAALIGLVLHKYIKMMFEQPIWVCIALIVGGFVLLYVDRMKLEEKHDNAFHLSWQTALKIGFCQCLAMFPGVSRSGSTIVGAMLFGVSKRAAAEFSFFLAMPTMIGAFTLDLLKNYKNMEWSEGTAIVIGFAAAFLSGLLVVRSLLDYVSRYGYAFFGWWRIIVGTLGIILIVALK